MTTQTIDPLHRAATADRLERLFRLAVAYSDDQGDIALAIDVLTERDTSGGAFFLRELIRQMFRAGTDDAIPLTHEMRVSLYVAAKAMTR